MVYNEAAGFVMGNSHKIVSAEEVKAALDVDPSHYYIIDVRGAGQFNAGHVPGSINVTLGALWSHIEAGQVPLDKPVLVVCSAGQQSGWANGLLNLMGYDSWSLDWGMPAWNLVAGNMWAGGTSDQATGEKTADIPETVGPFPDPVLSGTGGPEELAVQQAQAVFQGGFKLKTWSSVKNSLADYHIIYYGSIAEYEAGHLPGAHHFEPFVDLAPQGKLATLAGDNNILVTSCSGQKAASIAAVLNALGYQAWFLKFGHNSLWHSELTDCAWHNSFSMSYPVAP
jgi:rhodanese-related sulfurtransferase